MDSSTVLCLFFERLFGEGERVRSPAFTEFVGLFSRFLAGETSSGLGSPLGAGSAGTRRAASSALSLLDPCGGWSFVECEAAAEASLVSAGAA